MQIILVVEDEPTILLLAEFVLQDAGYDVKTASDGNQALAILSREPTLDLLVTDINMGDGPDGHAVAAAALKLKHPPRVVYTTALTLTDGLQALLVPDSLYVGKPYDGTRLLGAVKEALA